MTAIDDRLPWGTWRTWLLGLAVVALIAVARSGVDPVFTYAVGLVVFTLYMWWFVTTGVAMIDRDGRR